MKRWLPSVVAIAVAAFGVFFYFYPAPLNSLFSQLEAPARFAGKLELRDIAREIVTPPPLRLAEEAAVETVLTAAGVFRETNAARESAGLTPLTRAAALDAAASLKLRDMFSGQYFEHVSPGGVGVDVWVGKAGYEYIAVGENLALGDFEDDAALVRAWMESPGHRANILHDRFREIGIAVGKGSFDGRETWLAVQIFALPLAACLQPNVALKASIEAYEARIDELQENLETLKRDIDGTRPKRGDAYAEKVDAYNALVTQYNELLPMLQALIDRYNGQVRLSNECISGAAE